MEGALGSKARRGLREYGGYEGKMKTEYIESHTSKTSSYALIYISNHAPGF
jgi:hypothetical protein